MEEIQKEVGEKASKVKSIDIDPVPVKLPDSIIDSLDIAKKGDIVFFKINPDVFSNIPAAHIKGFFVTLQEAEKETGIRIIAMLSGFADYEIKKEPMHE